MDVRWLFLDMNAFFASAEQQLDPTLRGLPVAVVPVMSDSTCCIAASYEARRYGVRTGTNVGEARRMCPGLRLVEGRHEQYVALHHKIVGAVETVLPVDRVCSIDEMACRLSPPDRTAEGSRRVALAVKRAVARDVGEFLRMSIGLAPNPFLAKVASNLVKPDGLSTLSGEGLPESLYALALDDLPGIGPRMKRRLELMGVTSVERLCGLSLDTMRFVWKSVVGEVWWRQLRGEEVIAPPTKRRSVGHSHVLPPGLRSDEGAWSVLVRLLHKAAVRLRKLGCWARRIDVGVRFVGGGKWHRWTKVTPCQDTPTLLRILRAEWERRPRFGVGPMKVSVTLSGLTVTASTTASLFAEDQRALGASRAMDAVNERFGATAVYLASMHNTRDAVPLRIAFTCIPEVEAPHSRRPPRRRGRAGG
jgi:DNA polymerase IV